MNNEESPQWECTVCGKVGAVPCHGQGARKPVNATARREHIAELDVMRERNCPRIHLPPNVNDQRAEGSAGSTC